ncbi:MAG: hypothetical protein SGARI_006221, partial [Bacillariaceae sp.]
MPGGQQPMPQQPMQPQMQQPMQPTEASDQDASAKDMATAAAKGAQEKLKGLIQQAKQHAAQKQPSGPNIGFKPTANMAKRHEDSL